MTIPLSLVRQLPYISKVIIHSLDQSLYQVAVAVDGVEQMVTDEHGQLLRSRNIPDLQVHFAELQVQGMVLRQQSAYDEMIHQPERESSNRLEVPLTIRQQ